MSAPPGEPPADDSRSAGRTVAGLSKPRALTLLGAALAAVAAFLPWVTASYVVGTLTVHGTDTDGGVTLAVATGVTVVVVLFWSRRGQLAVAGAGLLVAAIGVLYVEEPSRSVDLSVGGVDVSGLALAPALGLYLTAVGGVVMLAGAVLALRQ